MIFLIQRCWLCRNRTLSKKPLCPSCEAHLQAKIKIKNHHLVRNGITVNATSFFDYSDPAVRQIILTIKECEKVAPVLYFINLIWTSLIVLEGKIKLDEIIIPIPSTSRRRHGQLIAQGLAEVKGEVWQEVFTVSTMNQQKNLNQKGRSEKKFKASFCPPPGVEVLIVDDLLVTGSSMFAAAEALGRRHLSGFALAFQPKQLES